MRKLLSLLIFLYACNGAVQNKTATDSVTAASKPDSGKAVAILPPVTVEISSITGETFKKYEASYNNPITLDSAKFPVVNGELNIPTDKGGPVILKNNEGVPHDENRISFKYAGYIASLNRYLVTVKGYEQRYCLAIDKATGQKDTLQNVPQVSPDSKLLICHQYNPYETYENVTPPTEDISIYAVENNVIRKIFFQPYRWFVSGLYWKDNHTVYIRSTQPVDDVSNVDHVQLEIVTGTTPRNTVAINDSWKGTYTALLNEKAGDSRDQVEVELKVSGDSTILTESGYQVYGKYLLAATEREGNLFFTFKQVLDGGSGLIEREKRFGYLWKDEEGKYRLTCPYLDVQSTNGGRVAFLLKKK
ncbi:hypothetical protein [Chitinophaga qingshengii]|uniref:Uncharacterized protein n=1 Tax=Chitinophaga qingshengii TaxID=1569794 RepID=A0ABR7TIC9_9BACT|nr:hypothetical protein [Chitinophaga qingshengii]MBC9930271.1 hypothetical protein [Chitinophaga qingshengii]